MTTIDIILATGLVGLIFKVLYDMIGAPKQNPTDLKAVKEGVTSIASLLNVVDARLIQMNSDLQLGIKIAEANGTRSEALTLVLNDISNINKNVLVEIKEQTQILTKILLRD